MFESATQLGTHIGVPPTGLIMSGTEAEQMIDASLLFRVVRNVSTLNINRINLNCDLYLYIMKRTLF